MGLPSASALPVGSCENAGSSEHDFFLVCRRRDKYNHSRGTALICIVDSPGWGMASGFESHIMARHKQDGLERPNEMDLEGKSQIIAEIEGLKSDDGRSPRHTQSVATEQHHFELQTRDGHILRIRVHEGKEATTVFTDSSTVSITQDRFSRFDHPNPKDRRDEVVRHIGRFLMS